MGSKGKKALRPHGMVWFAWRGGKRNHWWCCCRYPPIPPHLPPHPPPFPPPHPRPFPPPHPLPPLLLLFLFLLHFLPLTFKNIFLLFWNRLGRICNKVFWAHCKNKSSFVYSSLTDLVCSDCEDWSCFQGLGRISWIWGQPVFAHQTALDILFRRKSSSGNTLESETFNSLSFSSSHNKG